MSLETVLSSLAGVLGDDLLDLSFERDHLASVDLDVCCLAFEAAPQQWFVVRHGWPPLPSTSPHSPVWTHARTSRWSSRIDSVIAQAKRIARAGLSSAAKRLSPVVSILSARVERAELSSLAELRHIP